MTMQSSSLLPALRELPAGDSRQNRSFRETITGIVNMDRAMYAAEFASAVSFGMWFVFDDDAILSTNFPWTEVNESHLQPAYERLAITDPHKYAPDVNVVERWRQAWSEGEDGATEFYDDLKGIAAEFKVRDEYNQQGYDLELADSPWQRGWDLHGTDPNGDYTQIQVKTGDSYSISQLQERMEQYPLGDVNHADHYAVATELYDRTIAASESATDAADLIISDIGSDLVLVDGMQDGLETLSEAMGIADAVPGVGATIAAIRLISNAIKTEKEFKAVDRTTRNKIQVVQTLTLMSRMGINTFLATMGGMGGGAVGSIVPGVGNLIGVGMGMAVGIGSGMILNRQLQPHMLNMALNITNLTHDDLFYYKNKVRIDDVALSFQETRRSLVAAPSI